MSMNRGSSKSRTVIVCLLWNAVKTGRITIEEAQRFASMLENRVQDDNCAESIRENYTSLNGTYKD
jgi:propanediol dehydratase small subunit